MKSMVAVLSDKISVFRIHINMEGVRMLDENVQSAMSGNDDIPDVGQDAVGPVNMTFSYGGNILGTSKPVVMVADIRPLLDCNYSTVSDLKPLATDSQAQLQLLWAAFKLGLFPEEGNDVPEWFIETRMASRGPVMRLLVPSTLSLDETALNRYIKARKIGTYDTKPGVERFKALERRANARDLVTQLARTLKSINRDGISRDEMNEAIDWAKRNDACGILNGVSIELTQQSKGDNARKLTCLIGV